MFVPFAVLFAFLITAFGMPFNSFHGPRPAATPEVQIQISTSQQCPIERLEDYHACNCCFLFKESYPALSPEEKIPTEELEERISHCRDRFGSAIKQCRACARMRICGNYQRYEDCFKYVMGEVGEFLPWLSIKAMEVVQEECFSDGK